MPEVRGNVGGRTHGVIRNAGRTRISPSCRSWMKFDFWEAALVERWKAEDVGDEEIAHRTMRTVAQIVRFDPVRPNGRRA